VINGDYVEKYLKVCCESAKSESLQKKIFTNIFELCIFTFRISFVVSIYCSVVSSQCNMLAFQYGRTVPYSQSTVKVGGIKLSVQSLVLGLRNLEESRSNLGKDFSYTNVISDFTQFPHTSANITLNLSSAGPLYILLNS
jgi:hypothetical protein